MISYVQNQSYIATSTKPFDFMINVAVRLIVWCIGHHTNIVYGLENACYIIYTGTNQNTTACILVHNNILWVSV